MKLEAIWWNLLTTEWSSLYAPSSRYLYSIPTAFLLKLILLLLSPWGSSNTAATVRSFLTQTSWNFCPASLMPVQTDMQYAAPPPRHALALRSPPSRVASHSWPGNPLSYGIIMFSTFNNSYLKGDRRWPGCYSPGGFLSFMNWGVFVSSFKNLSYFEGFFKVKLFCVWFAWGCVYFC